MVIRYRNDLRRELEILKKKAEDVFKRRSQGPPQVERPYGTLQVLVPGKQVEFENGYFYRVLTGAENIWDDAETFHREYLGVLSNPFPPLRPEQEPLKILQNVSAEEICYLDLETTGLSMVPLFLVGLMYTLREKLFVDQLFARDYTEETVVLTFLKDALKKFKVLVTFNGFHFDLPFLFDRMSVAALDFSPPDFHVDLLPLSRILVKGTTPNHKLQTLEAYLCQRKRIGDVSGSEIPDIYHEFVRTGEAKDVAVVFHHNRLDLLTMLQLVTVFLSDRA